MGYSCISEHCDRDRYEQYIDWGYYSKTNGDCTYCKGLCTDDIDCGGVECKLNTKNHHCIWWKVGKCSSPSEITQAKEEGQNEEVYCLKGDHRPNFLSNRYLS